MTSTTEATHTVPAPLPGPTALPAALAAFQAAYPDCDIAAVDALRAGEYARLDAQRHVYLDYAGGSLYAESQLREHYALLSGGVFGNPHSKNPTSLASTALADRARAAVLDYFNAPPHEYTVVFTSNASGALKLVGEAYPFTPGSRFLLSADNHNSVIGIREFARSRGAHVSYLPLVAPAMRLDGAGLPGALDQAPPGQRHLLAYPAQSNFSGVQHPLAWIAMAHARGWDVLLDAAAFAPTNRLDLGRWRPDFVGLSFYKLFGYPTGVGCLIARRTVLATLRRPWFAGGTVAVASVQGDSHVLAEGAAGFEDGTVNYLDLPAIEIGLRHLAAVGSDTIHTRVQCLTAWLLAQLTTLHHQSGQPLVRLYGPTTAARRGGLVAFNVLAQDGGVVDCRLVEARANRQRISLRTGCFCNPGAGEAALGLTHEVLAPIFRSAGRVTANRYRRLLAGQGKAVGAVRASLGIATTFADVYRLVRFVRGFLDAPACRRRTRCEA